VGTVDHLPQRLMIDCSHANSSKDYRRQVEVAGAVAQQVAGGERRVVGLMIESNLVEGRQEIQPGKPLKFGQSVTDGCVGWEDSTQVLGVLADAVKQRRKQRTQK